MRGKDSAAPGKGVKDKVLAFKLKPTAAFLRTVTICFRCPTLLPSATCYSTLLVNEKKK
jgi:hypothetical protein